MAIVMAMRFCQKEGGVLARGQNTTGRSVVESGCTRLIGVLKIDRS